MVEYGKRKCKVCSEVFNKRSPLDMFCSIKCNIIYKNDKAQKKATKSPPKPIPKFSDKRSKRNALYLIANKLFLAKESNKFCPVMAKLYNKTVLATEVHHRNGREGERLNDQEYWIGVSREGHQWIHSHQPEARENGWLI
jgi:hypothetical protein